MKCPGEGGATWREYMTAHFVIRTDVSPREAREIAARLEQLRGGILRGIGPSAIDPQVRVDVVVPRTGELEHLVGGGRTRVGGWFESAMSWGPRFVVDGADYRPRITAHELAHYLLAYNFGRMPRWLNEGLAEYFATIELDEKKDGLVVASVGRAPNDLRLLPRREMLAARERGFAVVALPKKLFAWGLEPIGWDLEIRDHYATAWGVVHYLVNRHPDAFGQLMGRLARSEAPDAAWRAAFPQFDVSTEAGEKALLEAVEDYVQGSEYRYRRFELTPDVRIVSERELTDAEFHVLWAELSATAPGLERRKERVQAEVDAALRASPDHPGALWVANATERADAAIAAAPGDWRGWHLKANALRDDEASWPARRAALEKAAELAPDRGFVLNNVAWALLEHGDSGVALPTALRAARLAPWDPSILDTLGAVLADLGRCKEALFVQNRAVEAIPEAARAEQWKDVRARLEEYAQRCGEAAPKPSGGVEQVGR